MSDEMQAALLSAALGALLGALSGGLVSFFVERGLDARRRSRLLRDQLDDLIVDFSGDVNAYWSSRGPDTSLQARILTGHKKISLKLSQLGVDVSRNVEFRRLIKELHQFATGGTFATKKHVPDLGRSQEVDRRLGLLIARLDSDGSIT